MRLVNELARQREKLVGLEEENERLVDELAREREINKRVREQLAGEIIAREEMHRILVRGRRSCF